MARFKAYIVHFKGGVVSAGYLKTILELAASMEVTHVRFGLRQDMIMNIPSKFETKFEEACKRSHIQAYRYKDALPNVVSSYPAVNIAIEDTWLREGVYKDVFDLFDYTPSLKVNICDQQQTFAPLYTGHLNWITSSSAHYWYLCVRFPKSGTFYHWPELVYTNDIAKVSKEVEEMMLKLGSQLYQEGSGAILYEAVHGRVSYIGKKPDIPIQPPKFSLFYYEGFNKSGANYWLGIYRRDELFSISFLMDICLTCQQTKAAQLYTTPWKSIIIKDIEAGQRHLWGHALGKHRINVRHAANELNWQIEDNKDDIAALKRTIIHHFDREDVRTYGLCFAIQTRARSSMFGSIIIRKKQVDNPKHLKSLDRFDILHTKDFNPNANELLLYKRGVRRDAIGMHLVSLCNSFYFYGEESELGLLHDGGGKAANVHVSTRKTIHQCRFCFTVYDAVLGDEANGVAQGTAFEALPSTYCCPLCEASKADFVETEADTLLLEEVIYEGGNL